MYYTERRLGRRRLQANEGEIMDTELTTRLRGLMAKATPREWKQIPQNGAGPLIAHPFETGKQMNPTGLRLICHMLQRGDSLEQDKANAELIAEGISALPTLLDALEAQGREIAELQASLAIAFARDAQLGLAIEASRKAAP